MLTTYLYTCTRSRLSAHALRLLIPMELFSKSVIFNSHSRKPHLNPRINIAIDTRRVISFHIIVRNMNLDETIGYFPYTKIIRTILVKFPSRTHIHFREAERPFKLHRIIVTVKVHVEVAKKWSCNNFQARVICFRVALSRAKGRPG